MQQVQQGRRGDDHTIGQAGVAKSLRRLAAASAAHFVAVSRFAHATNGGNLFPGGRSLDDMGGWPTVLAVYAADGFDQEREWVRRFWADLEPHAVGAYVNFLMDEGPARTRQAYQPESLHRLRCSRAALRSRQRVPSQPKHHPR